MYQRILVATDDSRLSRKAVKSAIGLAAALQAELVIVHVVPRYPVAYFEGAVAMQAVDVARIEKQWVEKGQTVVDAAARSAQAAGVSARGVVVQSDAVADALLSAAKKHRCDLVVMASHGRRGLQRVLLGSETQHVLTRGNLPVLVLR
ncbi:universal stress protein [Ramlibacter sp.]|uniref:universal stress protein n=1 Tax=Ramlibacter sp. TaxID=1917967 RepID=UPI002D4096ED|nr:universal stress protein [Ramlibacter sp.]HYD76983.1 universal stress protein [Ramlibacter sp.]